MAIHAFEGLRLGNDHVVHPPDHAGLHKAVLAAVRHTGGFHPVLDGLSPIEVFPVTAEEVHIGHGVVSGVIGLLAPHHLEGGEPGVRIVAVALGTVELHHLVGRSLRQNLSS